MKKIPVLETIGFAYNFTFSHLGAIIGLSWLPLVLWAVGDYFVSALYYSAVPAAFSAGNPFALGQAGLVMLGWRLISLLIWSVIYVAVMRQALGLRQGPARVHFAFGLTELRVFASLLALVGITLLFVLGLFEGLQLLRSLVPGPTVMKAVLGAAGVLGAIAIVYSVIRLSFLLIPVVVVESRLGLVRSWELCEGNVGRIVVIGIAVLGPAALFAGFAEAAVLGPSYFLSAAHVGNKLAAGSQQLLALRSNLPLLTGIYLVMAPFLIGLQIAPSAFAYRKLAVTPGTRT
jgi:hypothetical protein